VVLVTSVNTVSAFEGAACSATSCGVMQGGCDGSGGGNALVCGYNLFDAVVAYVDDADAAEATYGGPIGEWDVSCVTNMKKMFFQANEFNAAIDEWDVSSVTDMEQMFYEAKVFNGAIDAWDVSSVTDMKNTFYKAKVFNRAINAWDVSSVTNMNEMFSQADAFNGAIDAWDVSSVTSMQYMFAYAYAFHQNLGWCVGTSVNTDFAFEGAACDLPAYLPAYLPARSCCVTQGGCDDVACGTYNLFDAVDAYLPPNANADCAEATYQRGLRGPIGEWDVSCVTNMKKMFKAAGYTGYYQGNEFNAAIGEWDVSSVTDMEQMFKDAKAFDTAIGA